MPVVNLAAIAGTFVTDYWEIIGGLTPLNTINSDDGSTSYYRNLDWNPNSYLLFSYQDLPGDVVSINSLTQYATLGRILNGSGVGGVYRWIHRYGGIDYPVGSAAFPPSWTSHNAAITFGGGGGWTIEKVNNSLFGIYYNDATYLDSSYYLETYHKVSVDYVASGMFVITFIIPLLGIVSSSFDRLMRQLLPRVRYTREELERIRQDIRNAQRGYSFPVQSLNRRLV